jgi:predicted nucleotide-binding protein (sugar kinase/HSP70/actin superfamily)
VVPCRLGSDGFLTTSSGDRVALGDPRVKIYFPTFSDYHSEAWSMAARWIGLHPGGVIPLKRSQLERGLSYTSGRECLPLPICLGQLLEVHERRQPGEIAGFSLLRGGAPCVVDSFVGYFERFIARQQLKDLFIFAPHEENSYYGFDLEKSAQHFWPAFAVADILVEMEQTLQVVGEPGSVKQLRQLWRGFAGSARSHEDFDRSLPALIERLAAIPRLKDPADCPRVIVTGDFFTRCSPFFMEGVPEIYAKHGIILKPADLTELVLYAVYDGMAATAHGWGMEPGYGALAKGCMKIFQPEGKDYLQRWKGYQMMKWEEERYRREFSKTGLLVCGSSDVSLLFREAMKHVSPAIYGETIPTVGIGLEADREGYDGIILMGPFNCLAFRISEAILKPLSYQRGMPIITYESDGYAVSPAFLRQVDVHIQQVLAKREAARSERPPATAAVRLVEQLAAQFGVR